MTSPIPSRFGRYEIVERLGAGGMGVVYLATDPLLRRTVAIKVLPGEHNDDLRQRFLREARSVAALRHANIVTIYDIGEEDGRLFIAMERVEGESMAEAITRQRAYGLDRRLRLMLELCAALGYAHKTGVIHRDIKPGNLMIGTDGSLKVLDFGLARLVSGGGETFHTMSGAVIGTPNYMSPEQVMGTGLDHRSDIFSVGLVLYEWLSYRRAFAADSMHTVLHDIVYNNPPPIGSLLPGLDPRLIAAIDRAIAKDPGARYQSLGELAADLDEVLRTTAVNAEAPTVVVDHEADTVRLAPAPVPARRRFGAGIMAAALVLAAIAAGWYAQRGDDSLPSAGQVAAGNQSAVPAQTEAPATAVPAPIDATAAAATTTAEQVTIDVLPWARVRIVAVGHDAVVPAQPMVTPFSVALAPGEYRLECENGGVSPRTVIPITVMAGRPLSVTRPMQGFNAAQLVDSLLTPRQ